MASGKRIGWIRVDPLDLSILRGEDAQSEFVLLHGREHEPIVIDMLHEAGLELLVCLLGALAAKERRNQTK